MSLTEKKSLFETLLEEGLIKKGKALDLGCGEGEDAEVLAAAGFAVDAIDVDEDYLRSIVKKKNSKINGIFSKIEDFRITEDTYTLVSSQYALHFLTKEDTAKTIRHIVAGSKDGGVITFTLMSTEDEWVKNGKWSGWTKEEALSLTRELPIHIHKIVEDEGMGLTHRGTMKWWQVFSFTLIKIKSK